MLIISKASRCDVCLEYYGSDSNSHPCVIPCGHTFCRRCISNLSPVICPLCRQHYDPRQPRRLVVDVDPDTASPASDPRSEEKLGAASPDPVVEEADRLQSRFTDVVTHGSTEPTLRALINDCAAFLRSHPNRFPQLRFSMRTISYLADTRTKSRSQAGTITSLAAEVSTLRGDLDLQKVEFEKQIEELTERARLEGEAAKNENEELAAQNETLTAEFKNLKLEYARLRHMCLRLAALTGQTVPDFQDVNIEVEPEDDVVAQDEEQPRGEKDFSPIPSAEGSPLCENILSPMPEIPSLSSLGYTASEAASTPFDDTRSTLSAEDLPLLTPQREELPFPFVPSSPAVDLRSHHPGRLRGHSFISAAGDDHILPPLDDPTINEEDSESPSPLLPPSAIPRPAQSGLSLTAPSRRRNSNQNQYSPPRLGPYHEEKQNKDTSSLSRLHDLLNYSTQPTTSSSLPVLQSTHLSRRSSRRDISSRHTSPRDHEAPLASPPPSSKMSSASQAAMMLEAKKAERQRAERYPRDVPQNPHSSNRLSRNSVEIDYSAGSSSLPSSSSLSRMNSFSSSNKRTGVTSSSGYATLGYKKSNSGLRDDHHGKMYSDKRDESNKYSADGRKSANPNHHIGLSAMRP